MMQWDGLLTQEERTILRLRALFEQYGYRKFKMSKFESYDFYAQNRNFLTTKNIITFQGIQGQLLALKPDVTLSIIKRSKATANCPERVYYNESVYRARKDEDEYREITQVGLEYIGTVDDYVTSEVVLLAKKSLDTISSRSVLNISHMGFVQGILEETGVDQMTQQNLLSCIGEKNIHGIQRICQEHNISNDFTDRLCSMTNIHGTLSETLQQIQKLCCNTKTESAFAELERLEQNLKACIYDTGIQLDISVVNDISYYNGIVFQGFVEGIPNSIISGGRYDNLVQKCGKSQNAIGFAVYLDLLERYFTTQQCYDVDTVLICQEHSNAIDILRAVQMLQSMGLSVVVQKQKDERMTYRQICALTESGVEVIG